MGKALKDLRMKNEPKTINYYDPKLRIEEIQKTGFNSCILRVSSFQLQKATFGV